jgi:hypothetical protein
VELQSAVAWGIVGRINVFGTVSEVTCQEGNILSKVSVSLLRVTCTCFVKWSLESSRRAKYLTEVFQGMAIF